MNTQAVAIKDEVSFTPARRINQALTAAVEKRVLQWMAHRAPRFRNDAEWFLRRMGG